MSLAQEIFDRPAIDLHTRPGSTRRFQPGCTVTSDLVRSIVQVSCGLHGVSDILVLKHWDCGDHGGSHNFASPEEELETYVGDLRRVKSVLGIKIVMAVEELLASTRSEQIKRNLQALHEHGLNIRYMVLVPRDLHALSTTIVPEDCYPLEVK
ncbi:MAG: hypothetical protein C3F02_03960 [Parcubacteria group bacterium]|nr:MAG: hypothetical protein C3F02_03960 [Parcubacteria group bacterium]